MTASGRELISTNGCFGDVEPEKSRSERRAALGKPEGPLWVAYRYWLAAINSPLCVARRSFAAVQRVCAVWLSAAAHCRSALSGQEQTLASDRFADQFLTLTTSGVQLCGMHSEYCVDTTTRRALALGFAVVLISDAHNSAGNEAITAAQVIADHNATLTTISSFGPKAVAVSAGELSVEA